MGFQNVYHGFGNLVIWLWKFVGKFLEIFLKEFVRTLICVNENIDYGYFCGPLFLGITYHHETY